VMGFASEIEYRIESPNLKQDLDQTIPQSDLSKFLLTVGKSKRVECQDVAI
jgi:hypothetical protein